MPAAPLCVHSCAHHRLASPSKRFNASRKSNLTCIVLSLPTGTSVFWSHGNKVSSLHIEFNDMFWDFYFPLDEVIPKQCNECTVILWLPMQVVWYTGKKRFTQSLARGRKYVTYHTSHSAGKCISYNTNLSSYTVHYHQDVPVARYEDTEVCTNEWLYTSACLIQFSYLVCAVPTDTYWNFHGGVPLAAGGHD